MNAAKTRKKKKPNGQLQTSLLIIGSRKYKKATVKALLEEARKLFDVVLFVPISKIKIVCDKGETKLLYKGTDLTKFDACYPRFSINDFVFKEAVLKILDKSDIYVPVSLLAYQISNHKYYTVKELSHAGVPTLVSSLFTSPEAAQESINEFGFPIVLKLISGFAGKGVMLIHDKKELKSILDTVTLYEEFISAQKFIEGVNSDYRYWVIGKKVIAAKRTGKKGEWRANISRGGSAAVLKPDPYMKAIALDASRVLKMDISAVDFIETPTGPAIIEVNFMPGPFKDYLGNEVPKAMVEHLHAVVKRRNMVKGISAEVKELIEKFGKSVKTSSSAE